ncbi:MAG TPA: NTP transferase domain-containing protein [Acidimicrobiales bacterium]|nr:NTP transferase domain-containing protein [Acidimicrobiales bacterium]
MQLVVLAAGHGIRFGGLKQLAPVGPHGEAIMDYTAEAAAACGFDGAVVVIREEIRDEIGRHIKARWPASLPVTFVCQAPTPGTAQAVATAGAALDGPFGVVNADDLYGESALRIVRDHFADDTTRQTPDDAHLLVAYRLGRTILTSATVKRGICETGPDGRLVRVVEHTVRLRDDGTFEAKPIDEGEAAIDARVLSGSEPTSMNLWGFHPRMLDHLQIAIDKHAKEPHERELLLVEVVGNLVDTATDHVRVIDTQARCIGVTHREDVAIVREQLAVHPETLAPISNKNEG